jgi:hypothetical protein
MAVSIRASNTGAGYRDVAGAMGLHRHWPRVVSTGV